MSTTTEAKIDTDATRQVVYFERFGFKLFTHHLGDLPDTYMYRWIARLPDWFGKWFNTHSLRLHCFMRSDADPFMHDHQWDFTSVLLTGPYWEEVIDCERVARDKTAPVPPSYDSIYAWPGYVAYENGKEIRVPYPTKRIYHSRFSIIHRKAEDMHRVHVKEPVWTFVWTGPNRRQWGFHTAEGWVYWRDFHSVKQKHLHSPTT